MKTMRSHILSVAFAFLAVAGLVQPAHAGVVELVDALRSGRSGRKPVGVRVPPSALFLPQYRTIPFSISRAQASMPPARLRTRGNPTERRNVAACSDRTPWWQ